MIIHSVRKNLLLSVVLSCMLSVDAVSSERPQDQLDVAREMIGVLEAYAVYKMGQYDLAFERYQALANKGSRQGMYNLANMYADGIGVPKDRVKAFEWYLKAAQAGDRLSMEAVAKAYEQGLGVDQNAINARQWRSRAEAAD